MKIAINTIIDYSNYGNRLQNYAMQSILEQLGHDVVTLRNRTDTSRKTKIQKLGRRIKYGRFLYQWKMRKYNKKRNAGFINFSKKYIKESSFEINENTNNFSFDNDIDCYVVGSDQVWNYNFGRFSKRDFIDYSSKPKISYAASFGVSSIPKDVEKEYSDGLNGFYKISVRESIGIDIVKKLCEKEARVVLDPTLLVSSKLWYELISEREKYNEKFILIYFLGEISADTKEYIENTAAKFNLVIKQLGSKAERDLWTADPIEFINLFSQASMVFTDSFHACVFSIIFEKYFEVFERQSKGQSMNSRIETLLEDFNLIGQWHSETQSEYNINYDNLPKILDTRRKESLEFLTEALRDIEQGTYIYE